MPQKCRRQLQSVTLTDGHTAYLSAVGLKVELGNPSLVVDDHLPAEGAVGAIDDVGFAGPGVTIQDEGVLCADTDRPLW